MNITLQNNLIERVEKALDVVRPFLEADHGGVELVEITDDMVVKLRLLGNCRSCSMVAMTMKAGVEDSILRAVPEVKEVIAVEDEIVL